MNNETPLNTVAEAIDCAEAEITLLDSLTRNSVTARRSVEMLTGEIESLHSNSDGLDSKARISRLTSTTSALALAESDSKTAERAIDVVQARAIAAGRVARSAAAEIASALIGQRRINARVALESLLDLTLVGAFAIGLENAARSVLELKELEYFFGHSENDPSRQIHSLRSLPQRFDELRELCANEPPGLVIPAVTVAAPVPVAAKPVITGNQLGTLVAAQGRSAMP